MKIKILPKLISILLVLSISSCNVEGEEVGGIWNAQGDYGKMKLEITPWKGKFHGYLLEYTTGTETIIGAKEEAFIFLTDLIYKENMYQNEKIYFDVDSKEYCAISLKMIDDFQLKATYDCDGQLSEEIWLKEGFSSSTNSVHADSEDVEAIDVSKDLKNKPNKDIVKEKREERSTKDKNAKSPLHSNGDKEERSENEAKGVDYQTTKHSTFYVIGVHQTVGYNDMKWMEKSLEDLWSQTYENDFSGKLNNISDQEHMYVAYSDYDKPKGKMTITVGYKVKDLSKIPKGLKGVKIPANDFLVYPISRSQSDYEDERWKQLAELMKYRKADSADFEIYSFDGNYEVSKAEMWIATK